MSNDEIARAVHEARLDLRASEERLAHASSIFERLVQRLMEKEGQIEMLRNENRRLQQEVSSLKSRPAEDQTVPDGKL